MINDTIINNNVIHIGRDNVNNTDDFNGADNNRIDRDGDSIATSNNATVEDYDINSMNIFRYKFTKEFMDKLYNFSKIHQYDHRKDFKDAWLVWKDENEEFVSDEIRRLNELGCNKDIEDKMFKSARYYFRKKGTEKKAPAIRRDYVGTSKQFISIIDKHIKSNIGSKPSECYSQFCKDNVDELQIEIKRLVSDGLTEASEIKEKIKKTYKNRYFMISKNTK
jgi:hypothetical protein